MTEHRAVLDVLLADHQHFHSDLQIDSFITSRAGSCHVFGMYVQALREMESRWSTYRSSVLRRRELELDLEELALRIGRRTWTRMGRIRRRRLQLELEEKRMVVERLRRVEPDRAREFRRFYAHAVAIKAQLGELTPERRAELDRDLWLFRLRQKLAIDLVREGHPSESIMEMIPALPREMRAVLQMDLRDPGKLVGWYYDLRAPEIEFDPDLLPAEEAPLLVE